MTDERDNLGGNDCYLCSVKGQHSGISDEHCACCGKPVAEMDENELWNVGLP